MHLCLIWMVLTASCVSWSSSYLPTVDAVLQRCQETREARSRSYIRSQTIVEGSKDSSGYVPLWVTESELYRKGALVDLYIDNFRRVSKASGASVRTFLRERQVLWNGSTRYEIHNGNSKDDPGWVLLSGPDSARGERVLSHDYPGGVMEGYFPGDEEDVLTVLRDRGGARTRVYSATLNQDTCYVIEADIKGRGLYRVWFDPAHGYNICRAEVRRTGEDTFLGKPVSEAFRRGQGSRTSMGKDTFVAKPLSKALREGQGLGLSTIEFLLYDVSFERSLETWLPVSGRWQLTRVYENGDTKTSAFSHRCMKAECGDDDRRFAEAFVPHIRDGTVVQTEDNNPLLRQEWNDGKPQLVIDWRTITITDDVVEKYIANLKERGDAISVMDASPAPGDPQATPQAKSHEYFARDYGSETKTKTRNHCGLYCVYAAVRASGRKIDFTELLRPEYLGSPKGSSVFDLKAAANDQGLNAEPVEKLTTADLKACPYCCILHMKRDFKSDTYNHYVLFLRMEDDKAVLLDAPDFRRVALPEIAPLWGGGGLVLATKPINLAHVVARGRFTCTAWFIAAIVVVALVRRATRCFVLSPWCLARNRFCMSLAQVTALGVAALVGALANHFAWDTGMLANLKATKLVQQAHSADFLPRIGLRRARSLLADGAVFVDARFRRNYEAGCIPKAMSIPVDVNESQYESIIASIPGKAPIVVYCQSAHCGFAGEMAARLARDGFQKVSIFRGGWFEWVNGNERKVIENHGAMRRAAGSE